MLDPQSKGLMDRYNLVLKKIIYDPERMRQFMQMMGSISGTVAAVKSVIGAIDMKKPIPPQLRPLLAINAYLLMLDMAMEATGKKVAPEAMKKVISTLASDHGHDLDGGSAQAAAPMGQTVAPAAPPAGIIQNAMVAA